LPAVAYGTVVVQTTIPPTPIAWLFAKRNARIAFRTTEDAKYRNMTVAQPEILIGGAWLLRPHSGSATEV